MLWVSTGNHMVRLVNHREFMIGVKLWGGLWLLKNRVDMEDLEKVMAFHSSTLAWKIPWTEKPGGLQSMGSRRVGHDWATSFSLFTFMHWRRKWQPTPVFLPGESYGRKSLVGYSPWGHKESDMTERLHVTSYIKETQRERDYLDTKIILNYI